MRPLRNWTDVDGRVLSRRGIVGGETETGQREKRKAINASEVLVTQNSKPRQLFV